jgi:O-antigen biosynthesis protein WbqP
MDETSFSRRQSVENKTAVSCRYSPAHWYGGICKRFFDIIGASVMLLVAALPMLAAALAIKIEGGGNVIFRQTRMGACMKPFTCYKFRTMKSNAPHDCATAKLENPELYITRVGAALRKMSIDELPQLFNVLKGEMSLVGPRPVITGETELISLRASLGVYSVKPGITGLAQVRGRDCLSDRRKAALDAQYIERMSLLFDIKLLCCTLVSVLSCRGIREGRAEK